MVETEKSQKYEGIEDKRNLSIDQLVKNSGKIGYCFQYEVTPLSELNFQIIRNGN